MPAPTSTRPLHVLVSPGTHGPQLNPYVVSVCREVERAGIQVEPFTRRGLMLGRPDVVHVHWPELMITWDQGRGRVVRDMVKVVLLVAGARLRGTRLVWTGHNLSPHDIPMPRAFRVYWWLLGHCVDHVISLTEAGGEALVERYPWLRDVPMSIIPHGHYRDDYPATPSRESARRDLAVEGPAAVLLVLGQVRRYKNIHGLVEAFVELGDPKAVLVVAGAARRDPGLTHEIRTAASLSERVVLRLDHLSEEEVSQLHAAADIVVLPYQSASALNSGSALLSLSLNTPVVAQDTASMRELRAAVGEDWVRCFEGGPDAALSAALTAVRERSTPRSTEPDLSRFEWPAIGRATARAYGAAHARARFAPLHGPRGRAVAAARAVASGVAARSRVSRSASRSPAAAPGSDSTESP